MEAEQEVRQADEYGEDQLINNQYPVAVRRGRAPRPQEYTFESNIQNNDIEIGQGDED